MENEEKKEEGKSCCSKGGCCCKAFKTIVLLVIGGIAGFFMGRHCGSGMCPMRSMIAPAATAPSPTPAK